MFELVVVWHVVFDRWRMWCWRDRTASCYVTCALVIGYQTIRIIANRIACYLSLWIATGLVAFVVSSALAVRDPLLDTLYLLDDLARRILSNSDSAALLAFKFEIDSFVTFFLDLVIIALACWISVQWVIIRSDSCMSLWISSSKFALTSLICNPSFMQLLNWTIFVWFWQTSGRRLRQADIHMIATGQGMLAVLFYRAAWETALANCIRLIWCLVATFIWWRHSCLRLLPGARNHWSALV